MCNSRNAHSPDNEAVLVSQVPAPVGNSEVERRLVPRPSGRALESQDLPATDVSLPFAKKLERLPQMLTSITHSPLPRMLNHELLYQITSNALGKSLALCGGLSASRFRFGLASRTGVLASAFCLHLELLQVHVAIAIVCNCVVTVRFSVLIENSYIL
jgi:hypothetical protein